MSQPSFNINSAFFLQQLDTTIIQLIKVMSVEHQVTIEQAKAMAFNLIQDRINLALLTAEQKTHIKETYSEVTESLKSGTVKNINTIKKVYNIFKLLRLDT
jgi:hypothetical protein